MVILDLLKYEGAFIASFELRDDETGEEVPTADVINLVQLTLPKTPDDPHRYQVVKDGPTYVLFPLDKPGEVRSWPQISRLFGGKALAFHGFRAALQQVSPEIYWGSIPENIGEATEGYVTSVTYLSDGAYDMVTWSSLDRKFTVHWDGDRVSLAVTGVSPISTYNMYGGVRFAYNQ